MNAAEAGILTLYYVVLSVLAVYSLHRFHLVRLRRSTPSPPPIAGNVFPALTVQLPVYNEPNVARRLIEAVAAIDYPGRLDIQVLDDSTDVTTAIVARCVAELQARGVRIEHLRRRSRDGFKAGALAEGLRRSASSLFAVFDADFVPPPDVLTRIVPHFADPGVGMVQARWTHLNRDESMLTRVQALFLDAHFAVESAARHSGGRFFNFNGTAGVWRREAIDQAGGWSSSTLTEDLDLSYRAQLAGWKFVFLPDVEVPAELPATLSGFQQQQHRWTKGSIQTARKLLPSILRADLRPEVKAEAVFHLTNNSAYLLSVVLALLSVPSMVIRYRHQLGWSFAADFLLFAASTASVLLFYREGQQWAGRGKPRLRDLWAVVPVGIGMSVRNGAAVVEGLFQTGGHFRRTPKQGDERRGVIEERPRIPWLEMALTAGFAAVVIASVAAHRWASLPFLTIFVTGYGWVALRALSERASDGRSTV